MIVLLQADPAGGHGLGVAMDARGIAIQLNTLLDAGAVVVKDVPPHSTAIGIPARVVQTRDPVTGTAGAELLVCPANNMLTRATAERYRDLHNPLRAADRLL